MNKLLITNNPMFFEKKHRISIIPIDCYAYENVLLLARDLVHKGHKLLTHPLSGSIKPNETPYKTIILSKNIYPIDLDCLTIIESSITTYEKFIKNKATPIYIDSVLLDFQLIDYDLINYLDL